MPITHAKSDTIADWSGVVTVANSTGGTTTNQASNLVRPSDWNSNHVVSLSASELTPVFTFTNGLTSTTAAGGITVGVGAENFYEPFAPPNTNSTVSAPGIGTWYLDPINIPFALSNGQIFMPVVGGASTNWLQDGAVWSATLSGSNTRYQTFYNRIALYKEGAGASTSRLESYWTGEASWLLTWERRHSGTTTNAASISEYLTISIPQNWNTAGQQTYTTVTASGTVSYAVSTGASTLGSSLLTGPMRYLTGSRIEAIPMGSTIAPGDYYFAHMMTSSTSVTGTNYTAGTVYTTQSRHGLLEYNFNPFKMIGESTTNSSTNLVHWHGFLATTTSAATSIINTSDVRGTTGRAYFVFDQVTK